MPLVCYAHTCFDWHATREYLCTCWFETRSVFLSYPREVSLVGAPVCLFAEEGLFSSHSSVNLRYREIKITVASLCRKYPVVPSQRYLYINLWFRKVLLDLCALSPIVMREISGKPNSGETREIVERLVGWPVWVYVPQLLRNLLLIVAARNEFP